MNKDFLRRLPLFSGLSESDLDWLSEQAEPVSVKAGETLMVEGDPGDSAFIVLDGGFEIIKRSDTQNIVIAMREPGEVIGEMSLLDHAPRSASVRAVRDSDLLKIREETFHQLLSTRSSAAISILHTVSGRLRQNEAMLRQSEKMAGLGTLAAGLAHELNNPAAAARRSAEQLGETLSQWSRLSSELDRLALTADQLAAVNTLREETVKRGASPARLDPMTQGDRESELQTWLEDRADDDAWELAPTLVSFGWSVSDMTQLADVFDAPVLARVARWLAAGCTVYSLLDEVRTGAERISEIVKSVKAYSYLDQAPVQEVDVREGLENTLTILRHKTKEGVKINRDFAPDLPRIEAYGSELNQVWTNILDNAIDAMEGKGEITLRTRGGNGQVVIEIEDNGPGIRPEIQQRIFEPFFTTKPPGVGTGLGLHIAYNIIHRHYGQIKATSQPGATCFQVILPLELPRR